MIHNNEKVKMCDIQKTHPWLEIACVANFRLNLDCQTYFSEGVDIKSIFALRFISLHIL